MTACVPHPIRGRPALVLAAFIGACWVLDRAFAGLVTITGLDDAPRTLVSHWNAGERWPIVCDLALHWLPLVTAVTLLAWWTLRGLGLDPRAALLERPGRGAGVASRAGLSAGSIAPVAAGIAVLAAYHLARDGVPGSLPAATASALYLARFAPSAWVEEVTFRGVIFVGLRAHATPATAWTVSLALFVSAHAYGGPALAANALILGVLLTAVYQASGSLMLAAALHTLSNVLHAALSYTH